MAHFAFARIRASKDVIDDESEATSPLFPDIAEDHTPGSEEEDQEVSSKVEEMSLGTPLPTEDQHKCLYEYRQIRLSLRQGQNPKSELHPCPLEIWHVPKLLFKPNNLYAQMTMTHWLRKELNVKPQIT